MDMHDEFALAYHMEAQLMDFPVNAEIYSADGHCGRSTYVIGNPVTQTMTHLVVKEAAAPFAERLVPVEQVVDSTPTLIRLRCTQAELSKMDPFIETEYVLTILPNYEFLRDRFALWPTATLETDKKYVPVEHENIPPGELAVHRGARVEATDGPVGQVDEFLVDPENMHITQLVLREGHLWGRKEIAIPMAQVDRVEEETVYLKLDKHQIEALAAIPRMVAIPN